MNQTIICVPSSINQWDLDWKLPFVFSFCGYNNRFIIKLKFKCSTRFQKATIINHLGMLNWFERNQRDDAALSIRIPKFGSDVMMRTQHILKIVNVLLFS